MSTVTSKKQKNGPTSKDYNDFIAQIEIADIRIIAAQVKVLDYSYFPSSAKVNWRMSASYEKAEEYFNVDNRYNLTISEKGTKGTKARISVTFRIVYSSKIPINDGLFEIFKEINLPLNTWPYFREFIHNTTLRMGWKPMIAPIYVV
jgi:preprotein translocase subunit SecB